MLGVNKHQIKTKYYNDFMKCKYCDFTCSNTDIYRNHMKKEHRNKCDKCYITFKDIETKNERRWDIHPNSNKHREIAKSCPEHITLMSRCEVCFFY